MSALEVFKNRQSAMAKIAQARESTKTAVSGIEIVLGSAASGYVAKQIGEVAGVPADVAIGLVGLGIGLGMRQRDVTALSLGFLAGYARDFGASLATSMPTV